MSAVNSVLLYCNEAVVALETHSVACGGASAVASPPVQRIALVSVFMTPTAAFATPSGEQWSFLPQASSDLAAAAPPSQKELLAGRDKNMARLTAAALTVDEVTSVSCDTPCGILLRVEALGEERQRTHAIGRKGATALALPREAARLEVSTTLALPPSVVAAATSGAHQDTMLRRVISALIHRLVVFRRVDALDESGEGDAAPTLLLRAGRVCRYVGAALMRLETFAMSAGDGISLLQLHASWIGGTDAEDDAVRATRRVQTLALRFADGGAAEEALSAAMAREIVVESSAHSMRARANFRRARASIVTHQKKMLQSALKGGALNVLGAVGAAAAKQKSTAAREEQVRANADAGLVAVARATALLNAVLLSPSALEAAWDAIFAKAPGAPLQGEEGGESSDSQPTVELSGIVTWLRDDFKPLGHGDDGAATIEWAYRLAVLGALKRAPAGGGGGEGGEITVPMAAFPHVVHKALLMARAVALMQYGEPAGAGGVAAGTPTIAEGEEEDEEEEAGGAAAAQLARRRLDRECFVQLAALAPHVNVGPEQAEAAFALAARAEERASNGVRRTIPFRAWCAWVLRSEARAAALRGNPDALQLATVGAGASVKEAAAAEEEAEDGAAAASDAGTEWLLPNLSFAPSDEGSYEGDGDGAEGGDLQWLASRATGMLRTGEAAALSLFVPCGSGGGDVGGERTRSAGAPFRLHVLLQLRHGLRRAQARALAKEAATGWRDCIVGEDVPAAERLAGAATKSETYDDATSTRTVVVERVRFGASSRWVSEVLTSVDDGSGRTRVTIAREARGGQASNAVIVLPNTSDAVNDATVTLDETTSIELHGRMAEADFAALLAGGNAGLARLARRLELVTTVAPTPEETRSFLDAAESRAAPGDAVRSVCTPSWLLSLRLPRRSGASGAAAADAKDEPAAADGAAAEDAATAEESAASETELLRAVRRAEALRTRAELRRAMNSAVVRRREELELEATRREKHALGRQIVEGLVAVKVHEQGGKKPTEFKGTQHTSYTRDAQKKAEKRRAERAQSTIDLKRTHAALERYESNKTRETAGMLDWEATIAQRSRTLNKALSKATAKRQKSIRDANNALRRNVGKVNSKSGAHGRARAVTYGSRSTSAMRRAKVSSFMYRYILRESCSQFDSLPLTSLAVTYTDAAREGDCGGVEGEEGLPAAGGEGAHRPRQPQAARAPRFA
jgi:hypothetical protein